MYKLNTAMDQAPQTEQNSPHREACDECHHRKIRCVNSNGACNSCIALHKSCTFSPRTSMGRPRKRKAATPLRQRTQVSVKEKAVSSSPPATTTTRQDQCNSTLNASITAKQDQCNSTLNPTITTKQDQCNSTLNPAHLSQYMLMCDSTNLLSNPPVTSSELGQFDQHAFVLPDADFNSLMQTDLNFIPEKPKTEWKQDVSMYSQGCHSLLDSITILSAVLFDLRRQKDLLTTRTRTKQACQSSPDANEILKDVTALCEIMMTSFDGMDASIHGHGPPLEIQSMVHLVIMAVTTTLDIYRLLAENSNILVADLPMTHPTHSLFTEMCSDGCGYLSSPVLPPQSRRLAPNGPNPRMLKQLELVLRLTTMDYHLAQIRWILVRLLECIAGNVLIMQDGPTDELRRSQADVVGLRSKIHEAMEGIKVSEDTGIMSLMMNDCLQLQEKVS